MVINQKNQVMKPRFSREGQNIGAGDGSCREGT